MSTPAEPNPAMNGYVTTDAYLVARRDAAFALLMEHAHICRRCAASLHRQQHINMCRTGWAQRQGWVAAHRAVGDFRLRTRA